MMPRTHLVLLFAVFSASYLFSCDDQSSVQIVVDPARRPNGIVGGTETGYNQWTGVLAVYYEPAGSLCSGTLIAPRIVLSAGHCVYYNGDQSSSFDARSNPSGVYILGGANLMNSSQIFYTVAQQIVAHPQWTGDVSEYGNSVDLSIIYLQQPIHSVPVYKVRKSPEVTVDEPGIIVGYGVTGWNDTHSAGIHRMGDTTILAIMGDMIEFGEPAGTCSGDSGGPLFTQQGSEWVVNGVASYVTNYCEPQSGHWNTSVVYYREWIDQTVRELTGRGLEAPSTADETDTLSVSERTTGDPPQTTTAPDTQLETETVSDSEFEETEDLECPWNTGYPCACAAQTGTCADGSACLRWPDTEYGVCAKACAGESSDSACRVAEYGIAAYGGGLCVLRTSAESEAPDHCLVLCDYKGQQGQCPEDLVCRDIAGNGVSLCLPPALSEVDTFEQGDSAKDSDALPEGKSDIDSNTDRGDGDPEELFPANSGCHCTVADAGGLCTSMVATFLAILGFL